MVYYLGRDVDVGLLTETANYGVTFAANAATIAVGATGTAGKLTLSEDIAAVPNFEDVVGVDIGIGAMDEDISYFGLRSITKAEIKKKQQSL